MWEFNNKYISVQLEFVVTVTSSGYSLWFCMFISMLQALMLFERWLNKTTSVYPSPHSFHCVVLRIHLLVPWSVYSEWLALCLCLSLHQESSQGFIRVHAPQFLKVSMAVELTEDLQASDVLTRFLSQDRYRDTHTHIHTRTRLSHAFTSSIAYFFAFCPLRSLVVKREDLSLYEIGGNISKCGFTTFSIYVCHYFVCWVK